MPGADHCARELALIREYDMLPVGSTVLCAVSGGADSMYLLDRLSHLRAPQYFDFTLVVVHYNHQLRGEESDRDEEFVRRHVAGMCPQGPQYRYTWPDKTGQQVPVPPIKVIVGRGDVAGEAKRQRKGIEETARQMRYAFFHETAEALGAQRIVTAHSADDNLETLLLNLARGAGLQGLSGIPPRQGRLARPMLTTTRREIEAYLRLYRIPHVEDSTNADEGYSRNKVRRRILPLLEELNPALRESSVDTIRYLRADNGYLNALAAAVSSQAVCGPREVSIPAALIATAPDPLAVRAARQLLAMTAQGSTDCAGAHLEGLVALCRGGDPSAVLHLPHGLTARRVYDRLVITDLPLASLPLSPMPLREGENPVPGTEWTAVLEGAPWPGLVLRSRRTGDALTLPNGHTRTLKRLFIDGHVPRLERERLPVAADDQGVLAVAGLGSNTAHPRGGVVRFIKQKKDGENT